MRNFIKIVENNLLNELKMPASIDGAARILYQYGYIKLGEEVETRSGCVFHKDGEKSVLKLYKKIDAAYTAFVELARQHQDNPHFPKFSKGVVDIKGTPYNAVRTEFLKPFNDFYASSAIEKAGDGELLNGTQKRFFENNPKLLETILFIKKELGTKFSMDLHSDNVMKRGDVFVITDPVTY